MGVSTNIAWCDHTFNPWWGCQRVSLGCENCYAETFAKRVGRDVWGVQARRRLFGDGHWDQPLEWDRKAQADGVRRKVFVASMADVFEDRRDLDAQRERLWNLIEQTAAIDYLLLTKRPQNMRRLAPDRWRDRWPENVWAGCTAEDQRRLDERAPELLEVPAAVHWLSVEPMLGPVSAQRYLDLGALCECDSGLPDFERCSGNIVRCNKGLRRIDWIVIGGESGAHRRPLDLAWVDALVAEAAQGWNCKVFVKQDSSMRPGQRGRLSEDLWKRKEFPR